MRLPLRYVFAVMICTLALSHSAISQNEKAVEVSSVPAVFGPTDTTGAEPEGVMHEGFTVSQNTSEEYIDFRWSVDQVCLFGSYLSVTLYRDGVSILVHKYPSTSYGNGWTTTWSQWVGPGKSYSYRLVRRCTGTWCDESRSWTQQGTTLPVQPPKNLSVTNPTNSDKFITMKWSRGSTLGGYFVLYEDGAPFATTYDTAYTVSTTPGNSSQWGVASQTPYGLSARVEAAGATDTFKRPLQFVASMDTTVQYVRLGWTCATDYATDFQIFRDGALHATIPSSQKEYLDYDAVPGQRYEYKVRSHNTDGLFSMDSDPAFGRAVFLSASDGEAEYAGYVYVYWTDFPPGFEDELRLYRDGVQIAGVFAGQVEKNDMGAIPGKIHQYRLDVLKENSLRLSVENHGFAPADGSVQGSVTTPTGAGVKNIEMRAYATSERLSKALSFDGLDDYVSTPALNLNSNTVTISAWVKPLGEQQGGAGIYYSRAGSTVAGLYLHNTGELHYNWNDDPSAYGWSSGLILPDSQWSFVALVIQPDKATIYLNDTSAVNGIPHNPEEFDRAFEIGRDVGSSTTYFKGLIDEVAVWNSARTVEQLALDRHHILSGTEAGLVAYWRFNQTASGAAGDYAMRGNHHGTLSGSPQWVDDVPAVWHYGTTLQNGLYTIPRITWEENVDFTVRPFKEGHGFKGKTFPQDSIVLPFSQSTHAHSDVNFVDTTSIEISGFVYLAMDPPCPLKGAKILVDGKSTGEYTDSAGHFSLSVAEAGTYTVSPEYLNHKFTPTDSVLNVEVPVTGLVFLDTTVRTLTGNVAGGCRNFLGVGTINLRSLGGGCVDTSLATNGEGAFAVSLPAVGYVIRLTSIDHPDSLAILNYFGADTIDLSEHDTTRNLIYHSPPVTVISDLPAPGCGVYNVPIMIQERTYAMRIDVSERYGDVRCPVESGSVKIFDGVAYASRDTTIPLDSGSVYYPLIPGQPDLAGGGAHPHQKMLVVQADVGRYTTFDTLWVLVVGQKPRETQFSTVSPELPLMILRDPPGDKSYSYLSTITSSSVNIGFSYQAEVGVGVFARAKVGGGVNFPIFGSGGAWASAGIQAKAGVRSTLDGTQEIKITTTDIVKTSDSDLITGGDGDVYLGAAINLLYGVTDILEYDTSTCSVVRDTGIVWNGSGFKTSYLYTESHIRNSVIPGLQSLAALLNASGEKIKQDSAKVILNQAQVWQQIVDYNTAMKLNARPLEQFPSNISFSAGTNRQLSADVSSKGTVSIGFNLYVNASVTASAGAKAGDYNEVEAGVELFAKLDVGFSKQLSYGISNTIGFELADDDADVPGDAFTVDILGDSVYGTPVFNLISGTSSCPWEHPTLPREGVGMTMNTYVLNNVPPETPAQFDLYLYNLGQNNETRSYLLSLVQGSNPDGAIISVGGAVLGDDQLQFSLGPDPATPQRATLRVERETGSVYDYENLRLRLASGCDPQIDTVVSFAVHFLKPCSDIRLSKPLANWILNGSGGGHMAVVVKDYDTSNHEMQNLTVEYRLRDSTSWTQLLSIARTLLPGDSILYDWDMTSLADGAYELRASTHCTIGTYSTRSHVGIFDRVPPAVLGTPEPADGSLDAGDTVRIAFNERINCADATKDQVKMHNLTKDQDVPLQILCDESALTLLPVSAGDLQKGDSVEVVISALADPYGNALAQPISWRFIVNRVSEGVAPPARGLPAEFSLEQNYPNPFNPQMKIRFGIPRTVDVLLVVYNLIGQEVARLLDGRLAPGYYEIPFDGSRLGSGIYFYRLSAGDFASVKKMVLLK